LIATIITVGIIASLTVIGNTLSQTFQDVKSGLTP
jgi:Flp pilus assembly pilin Flp